MYDLIVAGKGPAGISAAIYGVRAGLKVLVIGMEESALLRAHTIENYYGFPEGISGKDLFLAGIRQAQRLGVEIKSDENLMTTIISGPSEFSIMGLSPSEFPEMPSITDGKSFNVPKFKLKAMIDQTLFAVAQNDAKPVYTGSLFETRDGELTVVSVDGYRLAMRREKIDSDEELRFIVPGKTLSEVSKLIDDGEEDVSISFSRKHIVFSIDSYHVISRLLDYIA